MPSVPQAKLTVVAEFGEKFFLENLAVRADGSMLITVANRKEVWFVPAPDGQLPVKPVLVHTFEFMLGFVVEWRPDRFLIGVTDVYESKVGRLYELALAGWTPDNPVAPRFLLEFPEPRAGLNGGCMIAPNILLAAGFADQIWRVDLGEDASASARLWLRHDNMKNRPGHTKPEQPGSNGVQIDRKGGYVYYTSTSQQMMMRVKLDPATHDPAALPEFVAGGREWDDFLIDEDAGVAYVTTHRENTIDRVRLAHDGNREGRTVIAGNPFNDKLVGPSAGARGRSPEDKGRIAFFTSDGGTVAPPPDGKVRTAKVLRVELPPMAAKVLFDELPHRPSQRTKRQSIDVINEL